MNHSERGRLGALKSNATKAGVYYKPTTVFEPCKCCKKQRILVVDGICLECRKGILVVK